MINFKRASGFRTATPRAPQPPLSGPGAPYAALGFIARTSDGQLLRNYAPHISAAPRRRLPVQAHA